MKIVFWSPVAGQGNVTSSLLAMATYFATAKRSKVNVISTNCTNHGMQIPFVGYQKDDVLMNSASRFGIDALFRDAKGNRLTKSSVDDAALSISDRLGIYPMPTGNSIGVLMSSFEEMYDDIVSTIDKYCDYTFVDTQGGASRLNQKILATADVIVVCLNQSLVTINTYFNNFNFGKKKVFLLLTDYDREQKVSMKNLRSKYKMLKSENSAVIPHCTGFADALNEGKLYQWALLNKECSQKEANYGFVKEVELASKKLAKLSNESKGGKR